MGNRRLCLLKVLAMWVWSYKYWLGSDEIMLKFFNFWNKRKKTKKETDRMRERETLERGSVSSLQYKDWNFSFCVNYIGENATDIFLLFFSSCSVERREGERWEFHLSLGFQSSLLWGFPFLTSLDVLCATSVSVLLSPHKFTLIFHCGNVLWLSPHKFPIYYFSVLLIYYLITKDIY